MYIYIIIYISFCKTALEFVYVQVCRLMNQSLLSCARYDPMTPTLHLCKVELFQRQRSVHLEMGEAQQQLGRAPEFSMPGAEQKEFGKDWHSALAQLWRQTQCFVFANLTSCRCGRPLLLSQNPTIKGP